jgi:hypothetical protein
MGYIDEFDRATARADRRRSAGYTATSARYDPQADRVFVSLNNGLDIAFSPRRVQGLEAAKTADLDIIEISPSGLGLHFPKIDADVYIPALLEGFFGSKQWMAARLGSRGGRSRTVAKAEASRTNGRLGGRPRKTMPA